MTHTAAQQSTQPPPNLATSAGSAWAREKRFADVLGRRMAYVERGAGHPIVFLPATRPPRSCGGTSCRTSRLPAAG